MTQLRYLCFVDTWKVMEACGLEKVAAQAAERNPMNELRELMALCQHEIWSHWMEYLFSVSTYNRDGSVTIPPNKVARWAEQLKTHYVLLSEQEKEADREQADRVLVALAEYRENTRAVESFFERECIGEDGFHPNGLGYKLIAQETESCK